MRTALSVLAFSSITLTAAYAENSCEKALSASSCSAVAGGFASETFEVSVSRSGSTNDTPQKQPLLSASHGICWLSGIQISGANGATDPNFRARVMIDNEGGEEIWILETWANNSNKNLDAFARCFIY